MTVENHLVDDPLCDRGVLEYANKLRKIELWDAGGRLPNLVGSLGYECARGRGGVHGGQGRQQGLGELGIRLLVCSGKPDCTRHYPARSRKARFHRGFAPPADGRRDHVPQPGFRHGLRDSEQIHPNDPGQKPGPVALFYSHDE
jgi:hypothetical protein